MRRTCCVSFPAACAASVTRQCLRPAASGWLRPRAGGVRFAPGRTVTSAERKGSRIALRLDDATSGPTDHVLLATGYRIDIARLGVLDGDLLARIETVEGSPSWRPASRPRSRDCISSARAR